MYLTAHHVVAARNHAEGFNAFYYVHSMDSTSWNAAQPELVPTQNPGTLQARHIDVPPPGNRVRSFLDIVAADDTPWTTIRQAFVMFVPRNQRQAFPWSGVVEGCYFQVGMDVGLAQTWHREVADLYRAVQAVRLGG